MSTELRARAEIEISRSVAGNRDLCFPHKFLHELKRRNLVDICYLQKDTPILQKALQGAHDNDEKLLLNAEGEAGCNNEWLEFLRERAKSTGYGYVHLCKAYQDSCEVVDVIEVLVYLLIDLDEAP